MARSSNASRPGRALLLLVVVLAVVYAVIGIRTVTSDGGYKPKLALDLEGGTEIILEPTPLNGAKVNPTSEQLKEAVNVIRQRVNGSGVSEAEVTTQGGKNITVDLPGHPDKATIALVEQSAQMNFRPVLVTGAVTTTSTATPTPTASGSAGSTATPSASASAKAKASATEKPSGKKSGASPSATDDTNKRIIPKALRADTTPTTGATSAPAATSAASSSAAASAGSTATPTPSATATSDASTGTASDLAQITEKIYNEYTAETCSDLSKIQSSAADPKQPLVTCDTDGLTKYILGPVEVAGKEISSATAGMQANGQGFSTGQWVVNLKFKSTGSKQFSQVTQRLVKLTGAQNQFAIVLDQLVVSAPQTNSAITNGEAQISGNFTQTTAQTLAQQLKFGSLPISFQVQTEDQISALLGGQQLERGLLAGLIGLILVVIYSLLQYRALGLVTIFSLAVAGGLTYGLVVLLGETEGYRLSLAGVTGLIVAIGITADSFIVYFERVRDEVREGRPLESAVEAGWSRAQRTILASDAVNFLAAVVLYLVTVGNVRGFAFTLGLTTLIDLVVVFLFTKPAVTLLSRMHFFRSGHTLSGFSASQLGRPTSYAGRGRVRPAAAAAGEPSTDSIAARRAAAARKDPADPGGPAPQDQVTTSGTGRNS